MSEWRDIETAPKDGTSIIVYRPGWSYNRLIAHWNLHWGFWAIDGTTESVQDVTNWMPLPEPPRG